MSVLEKALSTENVQILEQVECDYWMRYYQGSSVLPTYTTMINGGLACAIPSLDILAMNRVLGVGLTQPITQATIDQIRFFYEKAGSARYFIQLPPMIVNEELEFLLMANGFAHHNNWTKLYRRVVPLVLETNRELSIRKIDRSEADNYGQLIFMSFDWEDTRLASWLASTVGQNGYTHYIVSWKGRDIAAGALFVEGEMSSMAFAGTLEPFRGLGAQALLLKKRMLRAYALGAKLITAETSEDKKGRPVASARNMMKVGFDIAYQRQNWIYKFDPK